MSLSTSLNTRPLFILHDQIPGIAGHVPVNQTEAEEWNKRGYGVYWVINDFVGIRLKQNLTHINAWFFEIDDIPKAEQWLLVEQGLVPSLIVDSKKSLHVYFFSRNATPDSFEEIQNRLIGFYGSDQKIKDPLRLMRAPGYLHQKDISSPYPVRIVWSYDVTYTEEMMRLYFPEITTPNPQKEEATARVNISPEARNYFDQLFSMDQRELLLRLSGTKWVRGEQYSFRPARGDHFNIFVNGQNTHCFIDSEGKIGAVNGGPTIWQWLKWFGWSGKEIKEAIKETVGIC